MQKFFQVAILHAEKLYFDSLYYTCIKQDIGTVFLKIPH